MKIVNELRDRFRSSPSSGSWTSNRPHSTDGASVKWYNRERIQKEFGWLSPGEYEAAWYAKNFDEPGPAMILPEPTPTR
jgi:hypothetical protein